MSRKARIRKIIDNIGMNILILSLFSYLYSFMNILIFNFNSKINLFVFIVSSIYLIIWGVIIKRKMKKINLILDYNYDDEVKTLFLIILQTLLGHSIMTCLVMICYSYDIYISMYIIKLIDIIMVFLTAIFAVIIYVSLNKYRKKWLISKGGVENGRYFIRSNFYSIGLGEIDDYYSYDNKYKTLKELISNFEINALKRKYFKCKINNIIYYFRNYDSCFNIYAFCDKMSTKEIFTMKSDCKNIISKLLRKEKYRYKESFVTKYLFENRHSDYISSYNFTIILLNEEVDEEFLNEIEFFEVNGKDGMFIPMIINDKSINYMNYFRGQMNVNYNYAIKEFKKILKLK